jgi:hypothetical protein
MGLAEIVSSNTPVKNDFIVDRDSLIIRILARNSALVSK